MIWATNGVSQHPGTAPCTCNVIMGATRDNTHLSSSQGAYSFAVAVVLLRRQWLAVFPVAGSDLKQRNEQHHAHPFARKRVVTHVTSPVFKRHLTGGTWIGEAAQQTVWWHPSHTGLCTC